MINLNIFVVLLTLLQGDVAVGAGAQEEPVFDEAAISAPGNRNPKTTECVEWPICPPDQK
ncbi:MAG: hypothetical protein HWE27_08920 [Gammaproteobacteria bacterium]|nr:hypothetical protein [Gammaproteobacteria bacterium]